MLWFCVTFLATCEWLCDKLEETNLRNCKMLMGLRSERSTVMSIGDEFDTFRVAAADDPFATNYDAVRDPSVIADRLGSQTGE